MSFSGLTLAQSMAWQTATAAIQAICSVGVLAWYVWGAHVERGRQRAERAEAFSSLVQLCHDLGLEAKTKTEAYLQIARAIGPGADVSGEMANVFASWKTDMIVIYVCLNEVPHYEVRSPAFSTALTRLWLEVDARDIANDGLSSADELVSFLSAKHERICLEVDGMARLLGNPQTWRHSAPHRQFQHVGRKGRQYSGLGSRQPLLNDADVHRPSPLRDSK